MSKETIIFGIVLPIFCIIYITLIIYLYKYFKKLSKELSEVKELAESAKTEEELSNAWNKLIEVNKKCWHRTTETNIIEIKTIIQTKYKILCQEKK